MFFFFFFFFLRGVSYIAGTVVRRHKQKGGSLFAEPLLRGMGTCVRAYMYVLDACAPVYMHGCVLMLLNVCVSACVCARARDPCACACACVCARARVSVCAKCVRVQK